MTSVAGNHYDIGIPVQKVVESELIKESQSTSTTSSEPLDRGESAKGLSASIDLDKKMKEMEAEMEKVRMSLENPESDGDVKKEISANDPHQTKTTKILRSYEKTTKRTQETHGLTKELAGGPDAPREIITTQHYIQLPVNVSKIRPKTQEETKSGKKEITTTIYESPSVTVKTISREGTPQPHKKVVIVREEDLEPSKDGYDRITISPGRQRIVMSPGRERITVSPGRMSQSTTSSVDDESKKEIKKTSNTSIFTSSSKKTTTTTNTSQQKLGSESPFKDDPFFKIPVSRNLTTEADSHKKEVEETDETLFDWDGWMEKQTINNSKLVSFDSKDGKKHLKLRYEISSKDYNPSDISVKVTTENKVLIHAEHKENAPNRSVWRECSKEYLVPKGVDMSAITSSFSPEQNILTVDIPLPING